MTGAALVTSVTHAAAQPPPLSLADALRRADGAAYTNRIAAAQARAQAGDGQRALQGVLPSVRIEAGFARTTDPIGTFGMTLRQRAITQADFDPALLNYPAARRDYGAALVVEQPLVNLDAWAGRRSAGYATAAARSMAEWQRTSTRVDVVRAWHGAVLMAERVVALEAAQRTALAHVDRARSLKREGVATRSDELLALVRAGEIEAELIEARGDAALTRARLATLLGDPADTTFSLPSSLPTADVLLTLDDLSPGAGLPARADVRAATEAHAAARADVQRARATLLPRINAMMRYDWHSRDAPFRGDENWSVGVMATWTAFAGGSQVADVRGASGRALAAAAEHEAALAMAALEAASAANTWRVALERVRIARTAVQQSEEALRIVTRRYEGGLAGVVELLDASALATASGLRYSQARYDAVVAAAEQLQRSGRDPGELVARLESRNGSNDTENRQ